MRYFFDLVDLFVGRYLKNTDFKNFFRPLLHGLSRRLGKRY